MDERLELSRLVQALELDAETLSLRLSEHFTDIGRLVIMVTLDDLAPDGVPTEFGEALGTLADVLHYASNFAMLIGMEMEALVEFMRPVIAALQPVAPSQATDVAGATGSS